MEQHDFSRVEQMSDAELVRWSVIFHHMAAIEDHLREITGMSPPDEEVAAIGRILQWELKKRTSAKGTG